MELADSHSVQIELPSIQLEGILVDPSESRGVVVFTHGSGSGRLSPRNTFVAKALQEAGLGTLLVDLLSEEEDQVYETRFNIGLLAARVVEVTKWLMNKKEIKGKLIGYFGASTGAAAALQAAANLGSDISAVVSRGGRPDLVFPFLSTVTAPTLLIVGERDPIVIDMNKAAYDRISSQKDLVIVPGATHLFEEPGTLEEVAELATRWFVRYLRE
ncbi:MAG: dienelactone hydrolase family protein [Nitrososphaerales archaeon]